MGWWAFDVFTQMAVLTDSEDKIASQTILRNIGLFTYMIPVGLMQAATFFIGKYLGKNRADLAKKIATYIKIVTFGWSLASMVLMLIFMESIMGVYTCEESLKDVMRGAWWIVSVFVFFDCMQGVTNGIVTGLSIINKVKFITMISYWVCGIPLSYYCMFSLDMGIEGLWFGPTLAVFINYIFYEINVRKCNWEEIAETA